jgi:parallel beta-helix repeat protein
MKGIKITAIFLCVLMMLSIFLIFQEEAEASTIDYIVLTDAPGGNTLTTVVLVVGGQVKAYASGYNSTFGYMGLVTVDWSQLPTLGNFDNNTGTSTTFTANTPGWTTVTGENTTLFVSDTFDVNITSVTVDFIKITDTPGGTEIIDKSVPAGYQEWGYCSAYNSTVGFITTVDADWVAGGGTSSLLASTPSDYNGIDVGTGGVTVWLNASYMGHTEQVQYIVIQSTVDYIEITSTPGGVPLSGGTVAPGFQEWGHCSAYNNSVGYIGLVSADWIALGGNSFLLGPTTNTTNGIDVGTIEWSVWFNASYSGFNDSVLYEVSNMTVDYIEITYAPGGTPLPGGNVLEGFSQWGYCSAYNTSGGYISLGSADWTVEGGSASLLGGTPSTSNGIDVGSTTGDVWLNASFSGFTDNVQYNVFNMSQVDYIQIRTAPNGGGVDLSDPANYPTYQPGENDTYWGAMYSNTFGYLFDVLSTSTWLSNNSEIVWVTSPGTSTEMQSNTSEGSSTITLNDGYGHSNTTIVTLSWGGTIDYIIIRDSSGDGGVWVGNFVYNKWDSDKFYAAGYNDTLGYITDVSVAWSSSDTNVGTVTTPGSYTNFYAAGGGTCVVSADYGGGITNDTGVLQVTEIDFIQIRDGPSGSGLIVGDRTYYVFQNDTFWAAAYNVTYGFLGDVNANWSSSNTSVGIVSEYGTQTPFYAVGVGTCVVTADYLGVYSNSTGTITVKTYNVDYIVIRYAPNDTGSEVLDNSYILGGSDTFYAAGYNNTFGYMGDVTANWSSNDTGVGTVTTPGSSTTFNAVGSGACYVTADYGGGRTDDTGTLTVVGVDYIKIRDAPNDWGYEVENMFLYTWENSTYFYAAAYNITFGYLGDVSVSWTSSDSGVGTVSPSTGSSTNFNPQSPGTCFVTAVFNATITDKTGILTVSSYDVDYLQIRDAPGGLGNVVVNPEYKKGSVDVFYGALYSNVYGYLGDVPSKSNWSSSNPSIVSVTQPGNSTTITCSDTNPGTAIITLWAKGRSNTTSVTVLNWTIDYISIRAAPGGSGNVIGDKTYSVYEIDIFYAVAFNYTQGFIKGVVASWSSDNTAVGTVTTPGSSSTLTAQWVPSDDSCKVTATYDSYSNTTGFLTVLSPRTDYILIRSADSGGGGEISSISYHKGDTDVFYGASYNNTVDFIDAVPQTSTWASSDDTIVTATTPGNSSDISCSDTNGGTVTVTLYDGLGNEYITTITVLNWTVDYILIRDSPLGGGLDLTDPANYPTYPVGHQTTFYGAMYNDTAGYIGDVASISIWTSNNTVIVEVTSPGPDSQITCSDTEYGVVEITLADSMSNSATTQVTVLEPTLDYIQIRDATGGMGNEIGDVSFEIGETDTFYAAAYNNTALYLYDVSVDWSSDDEDVGTVTTPGSSTTFTAEGIGTCTVSASYSGGMFTDTTGTITVTLPSNITVDDSGGKHFTSIQEAINNAQDGDTVFVYAGTYHEHLTITKSITLMGEDKDDTIIDGDDYGKVIFVTGDNVSISGFTIQDGEYAIYLEESDSTSITYNIIQGYEYGIYCNYTTDAYIAHNTITEGDYGIVTFHANNDAIRWNTISYNTEYGAKDYNSSLKNCFNWNYFYKNKIAYWYDPDPDFPILEFDGNVLEDNDIAIMVENTSAISITNNTASNNRYGVYLINASPNIADNTISDSDYGIYSDRSSPTISDNDISDSSEYGIYAKDGESLRIINNTMENSEMIFFDSIIQELWLKDSSITKVNTTVENSYIDEISSLVIQVRIVDEQGDPIGSAVILVYDANDVLVSASVTDPDGYTDLIALTEQLQTGTSTVSYNPYSIKVVKDSQTSTQELTIEEDTDLVISLSQETPIVTPSAPKFPWALVLMIGFIGAFGVSAMLLEVLKFGIISLFIPLYSRLSKDKLLDQPTRYKIFGYIIGNPGAHFGLIKDDLDLGSGQLVYHLKQLEEAHMVYSREDGAKKRFYPADVPRTKKATPNISDIQEEILGIVEFNSGIVQKKIASSVGISRQVAGYHLTKMEQKGLIDEEVVGREARYYASRKYSV